MAEQVPQPSLPLTARCLCGEVRWAVHAPLEACWYCHCTRCQHRTGTASSIGARVRPGSFELLSGESLIREWVPPDGHVKVFCSACGGQLWSRDRDDPEVKSIRLGAFDTDPGIRPSGHQFTDFAVAWEEIPDDGLPRWGGRSPLAGGPAPAEGS
jgi:hypothetical protein